MINILCVTCLFNFFIIFSNKTDGQRWTRKPEFVFFWNGGSTFFSVGTGGETKRHVLEVLAGTAYLIIGSFLK